MASSGDDRSDSDYESSGASSGGSFWEDSSYVSEEEFEGSDGEGDEGVGEGGGAGEGPANPHAVPVLFSGWTRPRRDPGPAGRTEPGPEDDEAEETMRAGEANRRAHFSPRALFRLFFTDDLLAHIVQCTNGGADGDGAGAGARWVPLTVPELLRWLALTICMGILKAPRVQDYWATDCYRTCVCYRVCCACLAVLASHRLRVCRFFCMCALPPPIAMRTKEFGTIMSGSRFQAIKARIRFTERVGSPYEPAVPRSDVNFDRLWKVRHLLAHVEQKSQALARPGTFITVDEAMCFTRSEWCARCVALL